MRYLYPEGFEIAMLPESIVHKTILIAPLDWGLGHATRCVPIIRQLMKHNTVILGVTPLTGQILKAEFPQLMAVPLVPYRIRYSRWLPLIAGLLLDVPRISGVIRQEHRQLQDLVNTHGINLVISDNRFGLWHPGIGSIYITHQLKLEAGFLSRLADRLHHRYIRRFNHVWVPDLEATENSLAGTLSRNPRLPGLSYIGPQSRLYPQTNLPETVDYLVLLSGPEPQRSQMETLALEALMRSDKTAVIVRGTATPPRVPVFPDRIRLVDLADAAQLATFIGEARTIVCRSGYSSLMDIHHLGKQALILVPTPGQGEQIYLASYWQKRFGARILFQRDLAGWKP